MYKARLEDTMNTDFQLYARYGVPNPEMTLDREFRRQFASNNAKVAKANTALRQPRLRDKRFVDGILNSNTLAAGQFFRVG